MAASHPASPVVLAMIRCSAGQLQPPPSLAWQLLLGPSVLPLSKASTAPAVTWPGATCTGRRRQPRRGGCCRSQTPQSPRQSASHSPCPSSTGAGLRVMIGTPISRPSEAGQGPAAPMPAVRSPRVEAWLSLQVHAPRRITAHNHDGKRCPGADHMCCWPDCEACQGTATHASHLC